VCVHSKKRSIISSYPQVLNPFLFSEDEDSFEFEREDFNNDINNMCSTILLLVAARKETISKLLMSAAYLDGVWLRCRVSKTMGTSVSMVGGGLTIAGGILTTLTAGLAAPLLIAGVATSSVGAATNIGTGVVEKILNSKEIKEMNAAFERDKEITKKFEQQLEDINRYKVSSNIEQLFHMIKNQLDDNHIILPLLRSILLEDRLDQTAIKKGLNSKSAEETSPTKNKVNSVDPGIFVESGKVIGQNSFRFAGQVIIGISAAFIVWDAIDLGLSISDLVRQQGSRSAKFLRLKAEQLENALQETIGEYSVGMPE